MRKGIFRSIIAAGVLAGVGAGLNAQTVDDGGALPTSALNLPENFQTFGKVEPNLRKATAIVNGEVITGTDVDHRLALVLIANGGQIPAEERERLRVQVMRNLIDETLQIQEAKANKLDISDDEVEKTYARISANFKRTPEQMAAFLRDNGSSERTIKRQILGEIAWSRVLRRRIEVNVSDAEVNAVLERLQAARGTDEYRVGEIFLSATPENAAQVFDNGRKIIEQLRNGGSFLAYARQFSEASTASVGGDLGWIRPAQLPNALATALVGMTVGQVVGPVEIPGGYSILYLTDQRKVLTADPRDAVLALRQLTINFDPAMTDAQVRAKAEDFSARTRNMGGCGRVEAVAREVGAEMVDNDQVQVRTLPKQLQDILLNMQVGEATPPFGSKADGVRVLVVCGRDEPRSANEPSYDQVMAQLEEERINHRAQRYLRDLRRDAVIDYR